MAERIQETAAAAAVVVQEKDKSRIEVLSFAVSLPDTIFLQEGLDDDDDEPPAPKSPSGASLLLLGDQGMVGTIVLLKKSAMVWFGWGGRVVQQTNESEQDDQTTTATKVRSKSGVGSAHNLSMGPLIVAMPRTKYMGAFSSPEGEASSSKLVGSDNEEEEMIARQMALRLSQRLGISVFVSCSLFAGAPSMASEGVDESMVQQRAAALAEREVARLLKDKF